MDNQNKALTEQLNNVNDNLDKLKKSAKWYSLNRTFTFRNHVTNRDYENQITGKKDGD